jgi:hypothetical protein
MKRICVMVLAALSMAATLLSCKKEIPTVDQAKPGLADLKSLAALQPNYVYTLAGNPDKADHIDGIGDQAGFINLTQLVADGGYLYGLDDLVIRKIKISDRTVTTLAGSHGGDPKDGQGKEAVFARLSSIALAPEGNFYIADYLRVRKVTKAGMVTTVAGSTWGYQDGPVRTAKFKNLISITVCKDGTIYVIDNVGPTDRDDFKIRKISTSGMVSTVTSGPSDTPWDIRALGLSPNGTVYAAGTGIFKVTSKGKVTTVKKDIPVFYNSLLPLDDGGFLIASTNQIKKVSAAGNVSVFAGIPVTDRFAKPTEGPAASVDLHTPEGFAVDNKILYFSVHPDFVKDVVPPYTQYGHVIQMIKFPY